MIASDYRAEDYKPQVKKKAKFNEQMLSRIVFRFVRSWTLTDRKRVCEWLRRTARDIEDNHDALADTYTVRIFK